MLRPKTVGSTGIWTKTLTASSLPAQALYKISITRNFKALTKTSYDVTYSCYTLIQATSGGSEVKKKENSNTDAGKGLAADKIDAWMQTHTSSLFTGFGFKVSKSGSRLFNRKRKRQLLISILLNKLRSNFQLG
jgi:hypothetical protein